MGVYAVQVTGGRELHAASLIERFAAQEITRCYVPCYELMKRYSGEWRKVREILFPGYLFVTARDPKAAAAALWRTPTFARLLGNDGTFIPLSKDELSWLERLSAPQSHVVEMSEGVIEGDSVVVTRGPLVGHEALIKKIDRHKKLAYLDMYMFGRTKTVRVGLEIVKKH